MALIRAKKVEVEIQKQTIAKADCKYMVLLKYEPEDYISTEILSVVLTDEKPSATRELHSSDTRNRVEFERV